MISVAQVKTLFPISLDEEQILPHLKRANSDFNDVGFGENEDDEIEAIGCKSIYYLAPLLWVAMSAKAREYAESIETFRDLDGFQSYWLKRSEGIRDKYQKKTIGGEIRWMDI